MKESKKVTWKLSGWKTGAREKQIPEFSQSPEKPLSIAQGGESGHVTFAIEAEEHKFFFKLNKKNKKNLSIQEVLAGVPWNVYFPDYSSYSELVYSDKKDEIVGTISTGLEEPSHTLQRDCEFSSDKTDYYSLAGVMVYSHTNCEDDLHRKNIIVINKDGKDHYYRIDFDMSYQSLTEKFIAGIIGIADNIRSALFPRPQLAEVKITPEIFATFPIGVTDLHFWPGVTRPFVGGETRMDSVRSFLGIRASDKGWDEAKDSDRNLTNQFTDLAYHPEFIKWKTYHYARYITTPTDIIEKEMTAKISQIRQFRIKKQIHITELQKQRGDAEKKETAPQELKKIDNEITQQKAELEILYNDEYAADNLKFRLLREDSQRRNQFKEQLTKIPEFVKALKEHQKEFLQKLSDDQIAFKSKYGSNHPDLDKRFQNQYSQFEKLIKESVEISDQKNSEPQDNISQRKQKIYKEDEFTAQLSGEKNLKQVAELINNKRAERRKLGLFTQGENDHFEKIAKTRVTQLLLSEFTQKINSAETIPEIKKHLKEAKYKLSENTEAVAQIEKIAQSRNEKLQNSASDELKKSDFQVSTFLKYAGGAVAVLLLAKVMLPPAAFHAVRVLGVDLLRTLHANAGSLVGALSVLTASAALGIGLFSRNRSANLPLKELNEVYKKVREICEESKENLPANNPSGLINALIQKIKSGKSESAKALKQEFGISEDDDSLLINQLTELSRALSSAAPAQTPAADPCSRILK